jgi:hypothetical protein
MEQNAKSTDSITSIQDSEQRAGASVSQSAETVRQSDGETVALPHSRTDATAHSPNGLQPESPTAVIRSPASVRPLPIVIPRSLGRVVCLTEDQKIQLQICEAMLQLASHSFVEAGLALAEIRDDELFIDDYPSFEAYCRDKWQYSKRHANQMIAAAQVVKCLGTTSSQQPEHETQVRHLVGLSPQNAQAAWIRAAEKAGRRKITARMVKAAIQEIMPPAPQPATPSQQSKADQRKLLLEHIKDLLKLILQKAGHDALLEKAQSIDQLANSILAAKKPKNC